MREAGIPAWYAPMNGTPPRFRHSCTTALRLLLAGAGSLVLSAPPLRATEPAPVTALGRLEAWLSVAPAERPPLGAQAFAYESLGRDEARRAADLLWQDHAERIRGERAAEMAAKVIELDGLSMKFETVVFGEKPESGHSLWISMHGGGGAPPRVNESQWVNQVKLADGYRPDEGIYLAPRAPTDTWNLWHQAHIDAFFDRIIENLVGLGEVDPDRAYLMGYSAGGDGVYQLAPRMADRFAAASMMAGHPNETSPLGLRNLPFAIHVGADDAAYNRNQVAREWGESLDALEAADPGGYVHQAELHAGMGHWMELGDRKAIPWMAGFTRNLRPDRIVWKQDDVTHDRFYWLALPEGGAVARQEIVVRRDGQTVAIEKATEADRLVIRLDDELVDLDEPVRVVGPEGAVLFEGIAPRTIRVLEKTLAERGDPAGIFPGEVAVRW